MSEAITRLVVPTKDRPRHLAACLISFLRNFQSFGRSVGVLVCDQSENLENRERSRSVCLRIAERFDVTVRYVPSNGIDKIIESLRFTTGIEKELIQLCLLGRPGEVNYGANRNVGLLFSSGCRVISVDDDTRCALAFAVKEMGTGAVELRHHDGWLVYPRCSTNCVFSEKVNLLELHEQAVKAATLECSHVNEDFVVTSHGSYGGAGMYSLGGLAVSSKWAGQNENFSPSAWTGRDWIFRQAPQISVHSRSDLMTMGYTVRSGPHLPPFCPCGRGEDALFSEILLRLFRSARTVDIPVSVRHLGEATLKPDFCTPRLSSITFAIVNRIYSSSSSDPDYFSRRMRDIGRGRDWVDEIAEIYSEFSEAWACRIMEFLSKNEIRNEDITRYYVKQIAILSASAWQREGSLDDMFRKAAMIVNDYGNVISVWGELHAAMREVDSSELLLYCAGS